MSERIENLKRAVEKTCNCRAVHRGSSAVLEGFEGEYIWDGVVEVFELYGHRRAKQCYAFLFSENGKAVIKTVLGVPPVNSALDAVRVAIGGKAGEK